MPRFTNSLLIIATAFLFSACAMQSNQQSAMEAEQEIEFKETINLLKTKCENNDAKGCFMLGTAMWAMNAENAENDLELLETLDEAQKYLLKSCDLNYGNGCLFYVEIFALSALGKAFQQVKTDDIDMKAISQDVLPIYVKYIKKSCELDSANGCGALGDAYLIGEGVKKDEKLGFFYRKKGCDLAQNYKDDMEKDLAERAGGNGCIKVGRMYYNGEGVAKNKQLALEYFYKGCAVSGERCGAYVYYFYEGYNDETIKVPQDYEFAFKLAKKGCDSYNGRSCNYLGISYLKGNGVAQDFKKAFRVFSNLCYGTIDSEADFKTLGCYNLAICYANGQGTEQNYKRAFGMFQKLCDEDEMGGACGMVGEFYFNAKGIRQDYRSALHYFGKACDLGEQSGCDNHKMMKRNPYAYGLRESDFR